MENRYNVPSVNQVFKDNILLNLHYLAGTVRGKNDINWENIEKPFNYEFSLKTGETFAFHDQILPEFNKNVVKTTNAHFNSTDGFISDGYLVGDGVCHFASLIYWAAKDAGLTAVSLASHDFAKINEVPREYGVSIKYMPGNLGNSGRQNLYITNNQDVPVTFVFNYDGTNLAVSVIEAKGDKAS
ncbi:MAG TPA: VanW family protein [Patescibacteria group bacterium]|nr:VanW family protein [Patescibacteria group bacterium]